MNQSNSDHWLVRETTIRKLWIGGCVVLALTVLAQIFIPIHGYFGVDDWFGFGAVYGFGTCLLMVLFAKGLGYLLKRNENYYNPAYEIDDLDTPEDIQEGHDK